MVNKFQSSIKIFLFILADLGETKAINDEEAKCMQSINQYSNNLMSFDAESSKFVIPPTQYYDFIAGATIGLP
jgi:hypothetical protein